MPQGEVHLLDLVARLRRRGEITGEPPETMAIVHIEVESREAVAQFPPRMYHYYQGVRRQYGGLVLPIAVYLRVGLEGVGIAVYTEEYDDLEVLRFQYPYIGLPALDAERYMQGDNWLGVALAALMRMPRVRRAWLRSEALRRLIHECPENEYRRWLLIECVDAYLELDDEQRREYDQLLQREEYQGVRTTMFTTFEKALNQGLQQGREQGLQQGREQGLQQGRQESCQLIRVQLEQEFGTLSEETWQRLQAWPPERLTELARAILSASSLRELGLADD